ncbi:hypothetical protein PCC9214_01180 [Planktothrix tepida]|uniref:Multidrug ABC transporter permease n=2 Tax=Planktothrix TaxID=54304 RepID=A0A1J1LFZ1_9CYAN|nr:MULTISPECIES: ABC-2 family transporter protein [Planktothrix]CAD5929390.1 hypothetical protein PCC9214_01180 [Planktothrix tepida]CAD5979976.1 hypothetical protein NO713_04602 [Planktothrix pseudagardhii]CUR31477.1 conserved membrane hypothetical protein [Planktothrix tepida PCC 9214]
MKYILKIAQTLLLTYYAYMVEYRAELFLWALSGSLPFILMGIWIKASQTQNIELSELEFARYFLAAFIVRQANVVWVIWEFEKEVVQGKLSPRLLQPIDPVWHHFLSHIAERFARLPFIAGLILLFFALYPQSFWIPSLGQSLLFLLILILAFMLRFIIQYTLALFSFWTERASAIEQIWSLPYLFLSGIIAPLEVFPPLIRELTLWTPFPYLVYFPASIIVGFPVDIVRGLLMIFLWGTLFFIINRWLWKQGLKQYSGMGA